MRYKKVLLLFPDYKGGHLAPLRPPAGLGYIAETLKINNIDYDVLDMAAGYSTKHLKEKIFSFNPDLIGISLMSFMYKRSYEIIKFAKEMSSSLHVVAGGPHVSALREKLLKDCPEIDYGVTFEGEDTIVELCKGKDLSKIKGLIYKNGKTIFVNDQRLFKGNLDEVPFPKYEKFPLRKYVTEEIGIVTSRGCPFNCVFCFAAMGKKWRKRSPMSVIEEIQYWYDRGYRQFSIFDDNFTLDRDRVIEICEEIKRRDFKGIEFNCTNGVRADQVSYEILKVMKEAGFKYICFGVEAGNNKVLRNINKGENIEIMEMAIKNAIDLGYIVTLFFLVGSPGETVDDLNDSVNLALKYPVFDARFYNLIPFPQTKLYNWVKDNNYFIFDPEDYLNNVQYQDCSPVFKTSEMNREERVKALKSVKDLRKKIIYNSMKSTLTPKLGLLANVISKIYVNDWFQDRLVKSRILRKNLKRVFIRIMRNN